MTGLVRKATLFIACGLLAASSAFANVPSPANSTVPCAIVLVGHNAGVTAPDPYGTFTVIVKDATNTPLNGAVVNVDLSGCCAGFRLGNTQLGVGLTHAANSAVISATTDATGTATFTIEGAGTGAAFITGAVGCASITATVAPGGPVTLTDGINHPTVLVAAPDLDGAGGGVAGVAVGDLALFINDKNAYGASTANYRQRSDFDYHLPVFNCVPLATGGNGISVADLSQWVSIKNAQKSIANGPFPVTCP